jgi:hypothetical protein
LMFRHRCPRANPRCPGARVPGAPEITYLPSRRGEMVVPSFARGRGPGMSSGCGRQAPTNVGHVRATPAVLGDLARIGKGRHSMDVARAQRSRWAQKSAIPFSKSSMPFTYPSEKLGLRDPGESQPDLPSGSQIHDRMYRTCRFRAATFPSFHHFRMSFGEGRGGQALGTGWRRPPDLRMGPGACRGDDAVVRRPDRKYPRTRG